MTAIDLSSDLTLGVVALLSIAIERTSRIWGASIGNARVEAVATSIVKWFPPILIFSFLTSLISSTSIGTEPWALIVPLAAGLVIVCLETRGRGDGTAFPRTPGRDTDAPGDDARDGRGVPGPGRDDERDRGTKADESKAQNRVAGPAPSMGPAKATAAGIRQNNKATDPPPATATAFPSPGEQGDRSAVASTGRGEETAIVASQDASGPAKEVFYGLTERGRRLVEFRPPSGRRGGGPLHIGMVKVLYYFYMQKGWFPRVDEGDEREQKPDLMVWEPKIHLQKLEDGTAKEVWDPHEWNDKPFHVEAETTPRKSKSSVIENYDKAWRLQRYVVFAVSSGRDADDLKRILDEIRAPKDTYEIDDISDLLSEDSVQEGESDGGKI